MLALVVAVTGEGLELAFIICFSSCWQGWQRGRWDVVCQGWRSRS